MKNKTRKIKVEGASGASYRFTIHSWDAEVPSSGAVYLITRRTNRAGRYKHTRIFAGQTGDLTTRLADHRTTATFANYEANCVCVLPEPSETERVRIESDVVAKYHPPCNGK